MEKLGPFTQHEIDLLSGRIAPRTSAEDAFVQDNANAVIPGLQENSRVASPPQPPGIDELLPPGVGSGSLSPTRPVFVPPTFIAKSAEAMEKGEKG